jgi:membrane-associated phospholipid phosphatase
MKLKKLTLSFLLMGLLNLYADVIETTGNILRILIPSIAYGATYYYDDKKGRDQFYKSFATNMAITYGLKYSVDKKRPNGDDYSFPSGHTSVTFASSTFIHKRYGFNYALPAYLASAFTGYSRVESDNHYTIDVLAGAVVGVLSSYFFTTKYKGYTITPKVDNGIYGFTFTKRLEIN